MAVYNEILVGRYNRFLQKVLGIKGPPPSAAVAGEVMPVLPFESFGVENRYLASWERFGFFISAAAVVAQRSALRFRNPPGSNLIAVFEKINVSQFAGGTPQTVLAAYNFPPPAVADFTPSANVQARFDARGRPTATLVPSFSSNAGASAGAFFYESVIPQTIPGATAAGSIELIQDDDQELPLLPGDAITLWGATLGIEINASVWWRERFLEESERS